MTSRDRLEDALDRVTPAVVAACILAAAAGSSIQRDVLRVGGPARWLLLGVLLVFAFIRAALSARTWRVPALTAFVLAAYCGLALASVTWSVNSHGTFTRAVGVTAGIAAIGALAGAVPSRPVLAERLLDGVLAAASIVALAGVVYWLVSPSNAAIQATTEYASRYQGIEQNPNTAALLLAIAAPIAFARALRAQSVARRAGYTLLVLGFAASIVASGSRSGLLASFVALSAVAALAPVERRFRLLLGVLLVAGVFVSAWVTTIPKALPSTSIAAPSVSSVSRDAELVLPLSQEIGNPWWTHRSGDSKRSLFNTSVRSRAWVGTIHRALGRPLLGYGFGAEQWAFVNRYYAFDSENPENGYLGLFLQLGVFGPLLFLLAVALCVVPGVRAARREPYALAAVGTASAGLTTGISQSYFHGPGNIAFVALWVGLLLAGVTRVTQGGART